MTFSTYPNITLEWRAIDNPLAGPIGARHSYLVYRPSADYKTWRVIHGENQNASEPYGKLIGQEELFSKSFDTYADPTADPVSTYDAHIISEGAATTDLWAKMIAVANKLNDQFNYVAFNTDLGSGPIKVLAQEVNC